MNCENCNAEVVVKGRTTQYYEPVNKKIMKAIEKHKIPFTCSLCGSLKFPYKAIRDVTFIWPFPKEDKVGSIFIPNVAKDNKEQEWGVVLSVGKGYWKKTGRFIPTEIEVGDEVVYDKGVPWALYVDGDNDRKHQVKYMGYQDVKGIVVGVE